MASVRCRVFPIRWLPGQLESSELRYVYMIPDELKNLRFTAAKSSSVDSTYDLKNLQPRSDTTNKENMVERGKFKLRNENFTFKSVTDRDIEY